MMCFLYTVPQYAPSDGFVMPLGRAKRNPIVCGGHVSLPISPWAYPR